MSGSCLSFNNINNINACVRQDAAKSQDHTVQVGGLDQNEKYQFRIRSSNNKPGADEIIWYSIGNLALEKTIGTAPAPAAKPEIASVNLSDGQIITGNPYIILVRLKDIASASLVSKVEFYIDDVLISTSTLPDVSGAYQAVWDTSKYHSVVKVIIYNTDGTTTQVARSTVVQLSDQTNLADPIVSVLPRTGESKNLIESIFEFSIGPILNLP